MKRLHRWGCTCFRLWGRWGRAPGWHYQAVERYAHLLSGHKPLPATLVNGCRATCDLRDHIQRQMYFFGLYEPVESYLFTRLLDPGMTVIDAGANIGQYTMLASTGTGPEGAVHSFEPVPTSFERLQHHVIDNALTNVHLNCAALWSEPTTLRLGLAGEVSHNSGTYSIGVENPLTAVKSPALRLDDYAAEHGLDRVGLIKMDIEGAELFALHGMTRLLRRDRPTLLVEINRAACKRLGYSPESIWDFLVGGLGYRAWAIGHSSHVCYRLTSVTNIELLNVLFHSEPLPSAVRKGWDLKSVLRWARGLSE